MAEQAGAHVPAAHTGVEPEHWAPVVHVGAVGVGSQTPFVQVEPLAHVAPAASHDATHWLFAQTSPAAHWLEYSHALDAGVHAPPAQTCPVAHVVELVHAHAPLPLPHVGPASVCAAPESAVVAPESLVVAPESVGLELASGVVTVPASLATHVCSTHEAPDPQSALVPQPTGSLGDDGDSDDGGPAERHEYPSHW